MLRSMTALFVCTGLSACGLKGPLVLPDAQTHQPVAQAAASAPATDAKAGTPSAPSPSDTTDKKKKPQ